MNRSLRWIERLPLFAGRPGVAAAITAGLVAVAFALRLAFNPILSVGFPYLTFFPAVVLTAFVLGARWGAVAAVASGILAWHFFLQPTGSFGLPQRTATAMVLYIAVVILLLGVIHAMQRANVELVVERERSRQLAETRALLFDELQHRVSNNLQVAAGLLTLQKRGIEDVQARAALEAASQRLAVIGRISRQLYDAEGAMKHFESFLAPLCADVVAASGREDIACTTRVDPGLTLSPDAAIPVALIVAEAVANAIEHGFANRDAGHIHVTAIATPGSLALTICDDGDGLPEGFELARHGGLGLRIAGMLADRLGGRFELRRADAVGTLARLAIPV